MISRRIGHPVCAMVSAFLAALLAAHPTMAAADTPAAAPPAPAAPAPPATTPQVDPWTQPSGQVGSPAPAAYPPPAAYAPPATAYPPGAMPYPSAYQPFMPNPGAGPAVMANPYSMGGVLVTIRSSSRPVRIDRVINPGFTIPVCVSPCRQVLPRNSVYIITGEGVRNTSPFVLPDDRDQVVLDVKPGSSGDTAVGAIALGAGLISAYVGVVLLAASAVKSNQDTYYERKNENSDRVRTVGGVMIAGGLVAGIVGLYYLFHAKTEVTSSTGSQFSEAPSKPGRFALTAQGLVF